MSEMEDQNNDNNKFNVHNGHDIDIQAKESQKKYKCNYLNCNAVFLRPSRLERHIRSHTGERPYKCNHPGCIKSYMNSSHLKRHLETHNSVKKVYKCTECPMTISNFHNLKRHYNQMHGEKKISCGECGKIFNKKYQLVQHRAEQHSGPTIYRCNKCTKNFTTFARFVRHQKTHEKHPCSECSEEFENWTLLCKHKKAKHETNYKCDACDKIFFNKNRLRIHREIHSKDRLVLPCPYDNCHRVYFFKYSLDQHVRASHLGKKFYCDICSMGLATKNRLIGHIQRHDKPTERKERKTQRKRRKDAGIPKRSVLTALIGIKLPHHLEKLVMERETTINDTATTLKVSE